MMFFYKSKKEFELTHDQIAEYHARLAGMKGRKFNCIAMYELTGEAIYQVSRATIEVAIRKLEKVLDRGARFYRKDGRTYRAIAEHESFQLTYEMAVLQVELKMHPSRAECILEEMLSLTENGRKVSLRLDFDD